jgi:fumarate hydratase subunit beta
MKEIRTPLTPEIIDALEAGDEVLLTGDIYTARDVVHQRLCNLIQKGEPLPIQLEGNLIYFAGPTPTPPGRPVGSAGPTTSSRMDAFSPTLIRQGLCGMIGKGNRSKEVVQAMQERGAVYFAAIGGAGALIAQRITRSEVVAYEDLGPEAIYRMSVVALPLIVAIDRRGNNLYENGPAHYVKLSSLD